MNDQNTKELADEIVGELIRRLPQTLSPDGKGLWSVCLFGSYPRGDFADHNSDLDFHLILQPDSPNRSDPYETEGYAAVKDLADIVLDGRRLHSHNPNQFDWVVSAWESLPKNQKEVVLPDGKTPFFPYMSILLFDYKANLTVLWGNDPRELLPEPLDFRFLAKVWFGAMLAARGKYVDSGNTWRIPFSALKSIMVAQAALGELTVDKRRLAELYQAHVPKFPLKDFGVRMLEAKAAQRYPDAPCEFKDPSEYAEFEDQLANVVLCELEH